MAELVDAHVSGACVERHAGSSPDLGTKVRIVQSFNQESEMWRNWYTRYFEGVVTLLSWEFESPSLHILY